MSAVTKKIVSLGGWQLAAVFAVLGVATYFAISLVLQLLSWLVHLIMWLQPLVSIVGALAILVWAWFALQEARVWRNNDWRATSVVERD
jgi:hypothetical protein